MPLAIASLIALLLAVTMAGTWLFNYCETWPLDHNLKALLISSGELAVLFFGVGLPVFSKFRNLLVHLHLPRLVAGIAVGYLAFVLQDQTYRIPNYFFENKPLWYQILSIIILFTICFGFGYFYLYADITQFTVGKKKPVPKRRSLTTRLVRRRGRSSGGSQNETRNRVLTTWLVALLISFGIGMFACVFMTDLTKPAYFGNYLGPFGWFNLGLLSFYMPISIVVGLISQFIFEEKSLTAPTWNAESML